VPTDTAKLVDQLGKMTVLELVELKNALEEAWGVTAAAPVAMAAMPGAAAGAEEAAEEQTAFDVMLTVIGDKKCRSRSRGSSRGADGFRRHAHGDRRQEDPGH